MDTSYIKDEDKDEGINLESERSTTDPHNTGQEIESDDETEATQKILEDYYKSRIDHNHSNFHMNRKKLERNVEIYTLTSIYSKNPSSLLINQLSVHRKGSRRRKNTDKW